MQLVVTTCCDCVTRQPSLIPYKEEDRWQSKDVYPDFHSSSMSNSSILVAPLLHMQGVRGSIPGRSAQT